MVNLAGRRATNPPPCFWKTHAMKNRLNRREFITETAAAAGVLAAAGSALGAKKQSSRPNILFIINDQHNPRHMGWAGEKGVKTPFIDQLASESVRITNGYTNNPVCGPSRHCLYTGLYASEHHVLINDVPMNPDCKTLMAHLNEVGYTTANVGKMHNTPYHNRNDFQYVLNHEFFEDAAGISHYGTYATQEMRKRGLKTRNWQVNAAGLPWPRMPESTAFENDWRPDDMTAEAWTTDECLKFMKDQKVNRPDQPFFLHASFFPPHHPYGPLKKYADMYKAAEMELPPNFDEETMEKWTHPKGMDAEELKRFKALYFAFITQFDAEMGRLLQGLEDQGLKENTIVVFVSDHGDMMGEHGRLYKGVMHEASARIPMLVRWPGIKPREENRLASMIDFMPTFLAAAGVTPYRDLPGENLLPLLENRPDWAERAVFSEYNAEFPYLFQMWRKDDYKLMVTSRRPNPLVYEFYNVAEDPYEMTDLIGDPSEQDRIAQFKEELRLHNEKLVKKLSAAMPKRPPRRKYQTTWPTDPWQPVQPVG